MRTGYHPPEKFITGHWCYTGQPDIATSWDLSSVLLWGEVAFTLEYAMYHVWYGILSICDVSRAHLVASTKRFKGLDCPHKCHWVSHRRRLSQQQVETYNARGIQDVNNSVNRYGKYDRLKYWHFVGRSNIFLYILWEAISVDQCGLVVK